MTDETRTGSDATAAPEATAEAPTVLVVEDETPLAELYEVWLADHCDVHVAADGEAGLDAMTDDVDVVLLDRRMPGMNGDQFLHAVKDEGYDAVVVMVTAVDADVDLVDLPIDDYLTKPVTKDAVVGVVDRMLRLSRAPRAVRRYHSLERRRDVLRTARSVDDVTDADAFDRLTRRLEKAAEDAGAGLAWLDEEYYGAEV